MFGFILYAIIVAAVFSGCYIGHRKIKSKAHCYDDGDSLMFASVVSVFWPATIWIAAPWLIINLYKKN